MTHYLYDQSTGMKYRLELVGTGYAGHGAGRNNPRAQGQHDIGPLPCGSYTYGPPHTNPKTGPVTLDLRPDAENAMLGRADFREHGDNPTHDASEGCVIMPRPVREGVREGDRLTVVASL